MASRKYSYSLSRAQASKGQVQDSHQDLLTMGDPEDDVEQMAYGRTLATAIALLLALIMAVLVAIVVYVELFYKWHFPIRIDCNLDHTGVNYSRCLERGCMYVVTDERLPVCFFPEGYGYDRLGDVKEQGDGKFSVRLRRKTAPPLFGDEFDDVFFNVSYETDTRLRLQVAPADGKERSVVQWPSEQHRLTSEDSRKYVVSYSERGETFGAVVARKDNGKVLFDTRLPGTTLADQFLQISTRVATENVFGLGGAGSKTTLKNDLNWKTTTFFAEKTPGDESNSHSGAHPFYMVVEEDGRAHGVFLSTSSPMDVSMQPSKATFRAIGGILDFYIFVGESPEDVIRQFTQLVGRPTFSPLWALGPHLAIRGKNDIPTAASLVEKFRTHEIKVSAVHLIRGYAGGENTADDSKLSTKLKLVREQLEAVGVKLFLRADPIVSLDDSSSAEKKSLFLTNSDRYETTNTLEDIAFVDFTKDTGVKFWQQRCGFLRDKIGFGGLVLGFNEPSFPPQENQTLGHCPDNKWNRPPYSVGKEKGMFDNGVCGHVMQDGELHYSLHNMYGYHHSEATWRSLQSLGTKKNERLVILSSSTFSGSGRYAGHWFHEPECTWENLKMAFVKTVEFSMFGMPYTGGSCSCKPYLKDVCAAWIQSAAFFPLSVTEVSTEPESEAPNKSGTNAISSITSLLNATSASLATRHQMTPHFYTVLHQAHTEGSPVLRPLFFEFSRDEKAVGVSYQFMWGPSVLVTPRVDQEPEVEAYFPAGLWYNFHDEDAVDAAIGKTIILPASGDRAHVHIRGGYIVPTYTREWSADNSLRLFVAPNNESKACGDLYWDDGITYHEDFGAAPHIKGTFAFEKEEEDFTMSVSMEEINNPQGSWRPSIQDVTIRGLRKVTTVTLHDRASAKNVRFSHDPKSRVLEISSINVSTGSYKIKISTL